MAKASPIKSSFNAGEFSDLLTRRVDLPRRDASLRRLRNTVATPQGPTVARSGTALVAVARDETKFSRLMTFEFSNEDAQVLEFTEDRIRFVRETGVQTYDPVPCYVISAPTDDMRIRSATLAAVAGDQVALSGFPDDYNLNGVIANIVSVSSDDYLLDVSLPDKPAVSATASRVYHLDVEYTENELRELRSVQSANVVYLTTGLSQPKKLSRVSDFDWRVEDLQFIDGPYLDVNSEPTTLTPSGTGNGVQTMTSNAGPGGTASASGNRPAINGTLSSPVEFLDRNIFHVSPASQAFFAFDESETSYWAGNVAQSGTLTYEPSSPFVCTGYVVYPGKDNQDPSFNAIDFAPSSWSFQGRTGGVWRVLDRQETYVLYDFNRSVMFPVANDVAYDAYRIVVEELTRNGRIEPRIRRLTMRDRDAGTFDLTASSVNGINSGKGFLSTDVGRSIRVKGADQGWRECRITAVTSTTVVTVTLTGPPLPDTNAIQEWRLGAWSDTTGWPNAGIFFDDRLWFVSSEEAPDFFAGSVTSDYEVFSQTNEFGEVLDDSAIVGRINARKVSKILWVNEDERGLTLGTGSAEYTIRSTSDGVLSARSARARGSTNRGSANVEPVKIDTEVVYAQRSSRSLREFAYVFEVDGYRSSSMSQLASHIGKDKFTYLEYAAEPHSVLWALRGNETVAGLTYDKTQNVVGWHQHDFSGGSVESIAVVPQSDQLQDALWLSVRRRVNGQDRKYIERLTRFWDFDSVQNDAVFVDSSLRYSGAAAEVIFGLQHLEGETVYGLADGKPIGPLLVSGGAVTLVEAAENVVLGLGYEALGELQPLESGASDGTAQGKPKRAGPVMLSVWDSRGGELGVYSEELGDFEFTPLEYPDDMSVLDDRSLYTGLLGPVDLHATHERDARLAFRKTPGDTLPFNMVAIMPRVLTHDG